MKVLVFGGNGKMGAAVAWDLVKDASVTQVGLVARRRDALEAVQKWVGSPKIVLHILDIADREATKALMKQYDVGVSTLPDRRTSYTVVQSAIEAGLHIVDMLEEYHRRPDLYELEGLQLPPGLTLDQYGDWLHEKAIENNVTFMDGIGFAPGLSNITSGEGIRKLDQVESVIARVGGIPAKAAAAGKPLRYMITWAFWHVLREYNVKLFVLKNGQKVEVDSATDREAFHFDKLGKDEMLECAVTPGMPSFIYTRPELKDFSEKTVRWPGHWGGVETLKECGLLSLDPVEVNGVKVIPRDVLLALIEPRLRPQPGDTDVCVMYCTVTGVKNGKRTKISYHMWDEADTTNNISSMGRVTGFPAAIGAVMIGKGLIKERGIVPPEDCIYGPLYGQFIAELKKRDIHILETIETIP
ncbi:MAG: saccharopine dehydrogenase C-terminal domain-containing protein [Acidobacteriota bacterium]